jgi:hypothetical protein
MLLPPTFTAATPVALGSDITSTGVNTIQTPVNNWINTVDNFTANNISSSTTIGYNQIVNFVDTTGGDVTITLPAISTDVTAGIWIKKGDISSNTVIIQTSGADQIEDPNNRALNPFRIPSTLTLQLADEAVLLFPIAGAWRIWQHNRDFLRYSAEVFCNTAQSYTAGTGAIIAAGSKIYDYNNNYNTSTYEYTAPFAGNLQISGTIGSYSTSGTRFFSVDLCKFGSNIRNIFLIQNIPSGEDCNIPFCRDISVSKGDRMSVAAGFDVNSNIRAGSQFTNITYKMTSIQL